MTFCVSLAMGVAVIPQTLLWAEGADYAEYTTGKQNKFAYPITPELQNQMIEALSARRGGEGANDEEVDETNA